MKKKNKKKKRLLSQGTKILDNDIHELLSFPEGPIKAILSQCCNNAGVYFCTELYLCLYTESEFVGSGHLHNPSSPLCVSIAMCVKQTSGGC